MELSECSTWPSNIRLVIIFHSFVYNENRSIDCCVKCDIHFTVNVMTPYSSQFPLHHWFCVFCYEIVCD